MRNIRIWAEDNKRCEAIWLSYLLTLCGCQVWKGQIDGESTGILKSSGRHKYVDILLTGDEISEVYAHFMERYSGGVAWLSGALQTITPFLHNNPYIVGISEMLEVEQPESLKTLMSGLSKVMAEDMDERKAIVLLTNCFVQRENVLFRSMYTISEMFCSRRIDYAVYQNIEVLIQAVSSLEEWLEDYIKELKFDLTYPEMFAVVYLQNLMNEGYIKARRRGGYDTRLLLRNANYILNYESESTAVHLLKLQILHNCVNFSERPDDILKIILEKPEQEYAGKALCETGDIFREDEDKVSDREVTEYYEAVNQEDIESYRGLYRAGLVYEEKAKNNVKWYVKAKEKYEQVANLIGRIGLKYRNPQEFEYFCKARYGMIKMLFEIERANGTLTQGGKELYLNKLEILVEECARYKQIIFMKKVYCGEDCYQEILSLMDEKMRKVQNWAKNLMQEVALG